MSEPTYAEARQIIFKIGSMVGDHEVHQMLDELLGILSFWQDVHEQRAREMGDKAEIISTLRARIDQLTEEAESFDSVLATNIMRGMAAQNDRLESITAALARLGAVVEGGQE